MYVFYPGSNHVLPCLTSEINEIGHIQGGMTMVTGDATGFGTLSKA